MLTLTQRHCEPEIIDQPGLDPQRHADALRGLERINWWSGSARILWPPIVALARKNGVRPLRMLDLATGAGDVPIRLWQKSRRAGLPLRIDGCDRSPYAVEYAQKRAAQRDAEIHFFTWDALQEDLLADYDVVTCSLFLHHLEEEQALELLRRMHRAARRMVLVNDLVRSRVGYALAYVGTRILTTSPVVHVDGPRSVEAAFTIDEARTLAKRAGMEDATVKRRWPCRYLLAWSRP